MAVGQLFKLQRRFHRRSSSAVLNHRQPVGNRLAGFNPAPLWLAHAGRLMGGHLPSSVVLDVDFQRSNAISLPLAGLHVLQTSQDGRCTVYCDLGVTLLETFVVGRPFGDGCNVFGLALRQAV